MKYETIYPVLTILSLLTGTITLKAGNTGDRTGTIESALRARGVEPNQNLVYLVSRQLYGGKIQPAALAAAIAAVMGTTSQQATPPQQQSGPRVQSQQPKGRQRALHRPQHVAPAQPLRTRHPRGNKEVLKLQITSLLTDLGLSAYNNRYFVQKVLQQLQAGPNIRIESIRAAVNAALDEELSQQANAALNINQPQQRRRPQPRNQRQRQPQLTQNERLLLGRLGATCTLKIETPAGSPNIVQIRVPDQTGASCGVHAVTNIKAIEDRLQRNTQEAFESTSQRHFNEIAGALRGTSLNMRGDDHLVQICQLAGLATSGSVYIGSLGAARGAASNQLLIGYDGSRLGHHMTFDNAIAQQLLRRNYPTYALHVIFNNQGSHWTSISVIQTRDMAEPVIIHTNSVGNGRQSQNINPTIQRALTTIAENVGALQAIRD